MKFLGTVSAGLLAGLALFVPAHNATAHDGAVHKDASQAQQHVAEQANTAGFPDIKGGDFDLIDQRGASRTSHDPDGRYQLIFFGYASCKAICSTALPTMAQAVDLLEKEQNIAVTPVLITVDRERDTVGFLSETMPQIHPRMVGLTGDERALDDAYKAFQIEKSFIFEHPDYGDVFSHGSFIYLLDPKGKFKTLFPPILSAQRIAETAAAYVRGEK